jgi:Mg-chelatase subunit ChlD
VLDAVRGKDPRLQPFGLETLRRTRPEVLRAVVSADLIDELLALQKDRHPLLRARALEVLKAIAGDPAIEERRDAETWWRKAKRDGWGPTDWPAIAEVGAETKETVTEPLLARALDLRDAGLDLVVVIDSTGSMQQVIDDAVRALDDVVDALGSVAPRLRLGLVHYRDLTDMKNGAALLQPLSRNVADVRKELSRLRAGGGGDVPERVEKGLEVAYDAATGWDPQANKLVLLVGDAPPHVETEGALLEMVRESYRNPSLQRGRRGGPTTGKRAEMRPFVTSAIATNKQADRPFQEIAEAGGGSFATLGGRGGPGAEAKAEAATVAITKHVLASSFGSQWRHRIGDFVSIWFEYRDAAEKR